MNDGDFENLMATLRRIERQQATQTATLKEALEVLTAVVGRLSAVVGELRNVAAELADR